MRNKLHLGVLPKQQKKLFDLFCNTSWISDYYLAGGTALALQIGHRRSIDFDFFLRATFDPQLLKRQLRILGDFRVFSESEGTINGQLNTIKVSFFSLPYPLIDKWITFSNVKIASLADISAMKLAAISSRGSKKDFVDLYFLLKNISFVEMVAHFEKKYGKDAENAYNMLKSVTYFADADAQPMPRMLKPVSWRKIKKAIISEHKKYILSFGAALSS